MSVKSLIGRSDGHSLLPTLHGSDGQRGFRKDACGVEHSRRASQRKNLQGYGLNTGKFQADEKLGGITVVGGVTDTLGQTRAKGA